MDNDSSGLRFFNIFVVTVATIATVLSLVLAYLAFTNPRGVTESINQWTGVELTPRVIIETKLVPQTVIVEVTSTPLPVTDKVRKTEPNPDIQINDTVETREPTPALVNSKWIRFPAPIETCDDPKDKHGVSWFEIDFDDSAWIEADEELGAELDVNRDGFYRKQMRVPDAGLVHFTYKVDDGFDFYINGQLVGRYGSGCGERIHKGSGTVSIDQHVVPGMNTLAVKVTNKISWASLDLDIYADGVLLE